MYINMVAFGIMEFLNFREKQKNKIKKKTDIFDIVLFQFQAKCQMFNL